MTAVTDSCAVSLNHVTVTAEGHTLLDDVSWQVARGERCFILGANGAGKTSLIKVLLGLLWPRRGAEVSVLGCRYGRDNLESARRKIAWASPFMIPWLMNNDNENFTVLDTVLTGADATLQLYRQSAPEEIRRAENALERLQGAHLRDKLFARCSSGEQVKALIARTMMTDPELLILDETCVHLDLQSREILLQAVDALVAAAPSTTVIFVTQRIEEITAVFQRGIIISAGRIAAQGPREEILTPANLRNAFGGLSLRLLPGPGGRLWPLPEN